MRVPVGRLGRVFGDRVLVKQLDRPEKVGMIFVPVSAQKDKIKEQDLWYGEIVSFGLDSRYKEAYDLKAGDIIGVESIGNQCAAFDGEDDKIYVWVAEEFIAVRDAGAIAAFRKGEQWTPGQRVGLEPIGAYSVIEPFPDESKRNGIHIPDTAKPPVRNGTVKAVSIGFVRCAELHALDVKADSEVLVGKYSGSWCRLGNRNFLLVKEEDIIAEMTPAEVKEAAHAY